MATPQTEDGFVRIANELFEALARTRIPGESRQALDVVLRMTYGWNRKEAAISLSRFVSATGLKRPNVIRGLHKLFEMNIVIKKDTPPATTYRINKDFDTWRPLSKKIHSIQKDTTVIQNDTTSGIQSDTTLLSKKIPATASEPLSDKGQLEPKDSIKDIFKDISLRERLLKEMKRIFPTLSIPDFIPDEKLDFLVYKVGKGEIKADSIKSPLAYLKAMTISETFPSFPEREAKAEKKRQEESDKREREKEEEREREANLEFNHRKVKELISNLGGKGWKTHTRSGTNIVVQ